MHIPVLLHEAVDALAIKPTGIYVDATFGRGGHSRLILSRLSEQGQLIAMDRDPAAVATGATIDDPRFDIRHCRFSEMRSVLQAAGIAKIDGVLLDLGVSSPQLDDASRGFSFLATGKLDMRMDTSRGQTAAEWLAQVTEDQLARVIEEYGEERYAKQIARAIVGTRGHRPIVTTSQLAEIIAATVHAKQHRRERNKHPATRTFQAIRIFLNRELEELSAVLAECVECLDSGGRLVVISFHSLEDRMVKRFMRSAANTDELPRNVPAREEELLRFSKQTLRIIGKAVRPAESEVNQNARARSAVMRVAERINRTDSQCSS